MNPIKIDVTRNPVDSWALELLTHSMTPTQIMMECSNQLVYGMGRISEIDIPFYAAAAIGISQALQSIMGDEQKAMFDDLINNSVSISSIAPVKGGEHDG